MGFERGVSRRELVQAGVAAGVSLGVAGAPSAALGRRRLSKPSVAVLGGGMAGLAAAHELVERGFAVTVYERKALGGKARSIPVPGTGQGRGAAPARRARLPLLPRLLPPRPRHDAAHPVRRATPTACRTTWSAATERKFAAHRRPARRPAVRASGPTRSRRSPSTACDATSWTVARRQRRPAGTSSRTSSSALLVFLTSCDERRFGQWEHVSWWDFVEAEGKSEEYQTVARARA